MKNEFISPLITMHMIIHCKSHTAVNQVTNKAPGPLVMIIIPYSLYLDS